MDQELWLEAERRGILPPEKLELLQEARRRGFVPAGTNSAASLPPANATPAKEFQFRTDPGFSGTMSNAEAWASRNIGGEPTTWARYNPARAIPSLIHGAAAPFEEAAKDWHAGVQYATSLGNNYPNPVSEREGRAYQRVKDFMDEARGSAHAFSEAGPGAPVTSETIGNAISPMNWAGGEVATGLGELAGRLPGMLGSIGRPITRTAAEGGLIGATQPTYGDDSAWSQQKTGNTLAGAIGGPLAAGGANVLGRMASPAMTDAAQSLTSQGVRLTPGQMAGPNSLARFAENQVFSPAIGTGGMVNDMKQQAIEDFNRLALRQPLDIIGQSPRSLQDLDAGHVGYNQVRQALVDNYDRIYNGINFRPGDMQHGQLGQELRQIMQDARTNLSPDVASSVINDISQDAYTHLGRVGGGNIMPSTSLRDIISTLKSHAADYGASTENLQTRKGAEFFNQAIDSINNAVRSTATNGTRTTQLMSDLDDANRAWAHLAILRDASSRPQSINGVFSPDTLNAAALRNDPTQGALAAQGRDFYGPLADQGAEALTMPTEPHGAHLRYALAGLAGYHAGGLPGVSVAVGTPAAGAGLLYNNVAQNVLQNYYSPAPWRQSLGNTIQQYGPEAATRLWMTTRDNQ